MTSPLAPKTRRVGRASVPSPVAIVLGRWHNEVMALDELDPAIVEAIRLRAAKHHDCRT